MTDSIVSAFSDPASDQSIKSSINQLWSVAKDMGRRLERTNHVDVIPLCRSLQVLAGRLGDAGDSPDERDVRLLPVTIANLKVGFQASNLIP